MKTLDISAYGVEEMSKQEVIQVEGGCPWIIAVIAVAVAFACLIYEQTK